MVPQLGDCTKREVIEVQGWHPRDLGVALVRNNEIQDEWKRSK